MRLLLSGKSQSGRLVVALTSAAAAAMVNGLLWPEFGNRYPLIGFYPAIVVTAWLAGAGAGVVCTIASSLIAAFVWLGPRSAMTVSRAADAVALTVFVTVGGAISLLTDLSAKRAIRERAARQRAERAERDIADEVADLRRLQRFIVTVFRRDDPASIVRDLLQTSVDLVSAAAAQVHVFDAARDGLRLAAQIGLSSPLVEGVMATDDIANPIAAAFCQQHEVVTPVCLEGVSDVTQHALPMITADGTVLGVLTTYRDGRALSTRRSHFLDTSVQQAAQAIERCRLLDGERTARREAEQASRLKDSFLSTVSHELRTPLNAVLGWAELLRSSPLSEAARTRALGAIADNAHRQMQLVAELLDVARITAGTLQIETAPVNVLEVVRKAVEVVEPAARAKDLRLGVLGTDAVCRADAGRLQQVVWNLLTNAITFTPAGGTIAVAVHRRGEAVDIEVQDTGQGIRASFLPHVFEPFRQDDVSTTRTHGGLGLGLSIVKHLVEAHGGIITADSPGEGQGACFRVRLPVGTAVTPLMSADERADAAEEADSHARLAGVRVLLLDDDLDSREGLARTLGEAGARVCVRPDARDALTSLLEDHVDVILADVAMPDHDGYAFIRRVRASLTEAVARIPAIAVTSLASAADRTTALNAGFQLHLTKPVAPQVLVDAVAVIVQTGAATTNQIR
jgi:K+-sensing histidine kinase KdpD/ActR/RegA family two-component response regulator